MAGRKKTDLSKIEKQVEKIKTELQKLRELKTNEIDLSNLYEQRDQITNAIDIYNGNIAQIENSIWEIKRLITTVNNKNSEITIDGNRYKELIRRTKKSKTALEEHVEFGIFFSNLDIKTCPHCNVLITDEKRKHEKETKECMLCTHHVDQNMEVDSEGFKQKIESLEKEIIGYEQQLELLRATYLANKNEVLRKRDEIGEKEMRLKEIRFNNREHQRNLKSVDAALSEAKKLSGAEQRILELEKQKAVLDYRIEKIKEKQDEEVTGEVQNFESKIEILNEAIQALKNARIEQNEEIINNFKQLLLDELHDLGISAITEVDLNDSYKISYNLNSNWVTFDRISEGEQLRVKIAFYLSIIQLDIKYAAGKHPRFLIIDSPNKEEGDQTYVEGLKKLLENISTKYKNDLQIILGTASRDLDGAVPQSNTFTYSKGEFVF